MDGNWFFTLLEVFVYVFLYMGNFRLLFCIVFIIIPVVYYIICRHPKISVFTSGKTFFLSTMLGVLFGIGLSSAFNCLMIGVGTTSTLKYPVESFVNNLAFAVSFFGYVTFFLLYLDKRFEKGLKWLPIDILYSFLVSLVSTRIYMIVYEFAEKTYGGIW